MILSKADKVGAKVFNLLHNRYFMLPENTVLLIMSCHCLYYYWIAKKIKIKTLNANKGNY